MVRDQAQSPSSGVPAAILNDKFRAPETFTDGLSLPKMIVFDLDYTLWPFWVDTHVTPPLKAKDGGTKSTDRWGESFTFYPDVPSVLLAAKSTSQGPLLLGTASRTHAPDLAHTLLKQLQLPALSAQPPLDLAANGSSSPAKSSFSLHAPKRALDVFDYIQIFPGDKKKHFEKIQKQSGVDYGEMLFFDDEARNRNVEVLGVTMWLVRDGVTRAEVDSGNHQSSGVLGADGFHDTSRGTDLRKARHQIDPSNVTHEEISYITMSRPKPPTSTSTPPPKPPLTAHPSALLSGGVAMTGIHPITIGANTVIHLRSKLNSAYGTIAIGEGCIIGERAVVGLLGEGGKGMVIGKGVVLEAGARVEGNLGDGSVVEAGGVVGRGAVVGKYCKICPHNRVAENENVPDYTIIYGEDQRRTDQAGLEELRAKAVEKHVETLKGMGMR